MKVLGKPMRIKEAYAPRPFLLLPFFNGSMKARYTGKVFTLLPHFSLMSKGTYML